MLRVSFSPAPECVVADCWNRVFPTPRYTRAPFVIECYCFLINIIVSGVYLPSPLKPTFKAYFWNSNINLAAFWCAAKSRPLLPGRFYCLKFWSLHREYSLSVKISYVRIIIFQKVTSRRHFFCDKYNNYCRFLMIIFTFFVRCFFLPLKQMK